MTRKRFWMLSVVWGICVVLVGGCASDGPGQSGKSVVVLFDLSESTNRPDVREAYCESFGKILASVDHGDAVAAGWILESSVSQTSLPVDTVLPEFDLGMTELMKKSREAQADSVLSIAHGRVCQMLSSTDRKVMRTDIMTSLDLAASIFKARGKPERQLIIMSDVIEDSERYQFDEIDLDSDRRRTILRREKEAGRLPDLTGTSVCVVGAAARETDRYYQIKRFWEAYFDSAGAELVSYGGPYVGC